LATRIRAAGLVVEFHKIVTNPGLVTQFPKMGNRRSVFPKNGKCFPFSLENTYIVSEVRSVTEVVKERKTDDGEKRGQDRDKR